MQDLNKQPVVLIISGSGSVGINTVRNLNSLEGLHFLFSTSLEGIVCDFELTEERSKAPVQAVILDSEPRIGAAHNQPAKDAASEIINALRQSPEIGHRLTGVPIILLNGLSRAETAKEKPVKIHPTVEHGYTNWQERQSQAPTKPKKDTPADPFAELHNPKLRVFSIAGSTRNGSDIIAALAEVSDIIKKVVNIDPDKVNDPQPGKDGAFRA